MASDGLLKYAKTGRCHICQRIRKTDTQVKPVGEVKHGYATGHIWECIDAEECERVARERIKSGHPKAKIIELSLKIGRAKNYIYRS